MAKTHDIVATVGEYTNAQGETKRRYQNVGALVEGRNGPYIVLEAWFNPAAIAKDGRVYLNLFDPQQRQQERQTQQRPAPQQHRQSQQAQQAPGGAWLDDMDQDVPF